MSKESQKFPLRSIPLCFVNLINLITAGWDSPDTLALARSMHHKLGTANGFVTVLQYSSRDK